MHTLHADADVTFITIAVNGHVPSADAAVASALAQSDVCTLIVNSVTAVRGGPGRVRDTGGTRLHGVRRHAPGDF